MIIWMDDLLFSGRYRYVDCIAILRNAANRRHTLVISDDPLEPLFSKNLIFPNFKSWLSALPDFMQVEISNLLSKLKLGLNGDRASFGLAHRLLITDRGDLLKPIVDIEKSCFVDFKSAARAVSLPLHILVENQINDAAFLRRVMPSQWRSKLEILERSGQIRYIQGGGISEIKKLLEFHLDDEQAHMAFGLPSDIWRMCHFIIYDHDGSSSSNPSSISQELSLLCDHNGLKHRNHRLERRAQENYLPLEILDHIRNNMRFRSRNDKDDYCVKLDAYIQLSTNERYFFDMISLTTGNLGKRFLKSIFDDESFKDTWKDEWFDKDSSRQEMIKLAESILASM